MTLGPDKRITLTLGLIGMLIVGVWYAAITFAGMTSALSSLQAEVHRNHQQTWSTIDMERWTSRLERDNRASGLVVPDPREIHP